MRRAVVAVALLAASCSGGRSPEEEAVRQHVLATAKNPREVRFESWGPNDLKGELGQGPLVRVCYYSGLTLVDALFTVKDGKVSGPVPTLGGNDWKRVMREEQQRSGQDKPRGE
jgi:hypothetical protein